MTLTLDHIGIAVRDVAASKDFYAAALAPLGISCIAQVDGWYGFGRHGRAGFWFGEAHPAHLPMHLAFSADSRQAVDSFFRCAVAAGARSNGAPGVRAQYHSDYYGAFVICLNGHNLEAVCHAPVASST